MESLQKTLQKMNKNLILIKKSINSSSSSENECLQDNAVEYAMKAFFSEEPSKEKQIGTITFAFQGKN